jgi:deoxyribodipyrimidine photo-lyase
MPLPGLSLIGFARSPLVAQPFNIDADLISNYAEQRDLPALRATSRLGVHLRFGTVSIRRVYQRVAPLSDVFVNELIWREFYQMIVWHFPHCETRAFKPAYDRIEWLNREDDFVRWKEGQTGYPLVDAGMRQLAATGWMHNRVRMVVASFLTKHLLVDWRWGEAWFAEKLLDFELASNNGGWQWAAGSGCDAAPYFRVFNPTLQQQRFDPQGLYVSEWVPGLDLPGYPQPMVSHPFARQRAVGHYKKFVGSLV